MFFSVVITACDRDKVFLPRVMTGLMNQTFKDFEVIIVVDGEAPLDGYDPHMICKMTIPGRIVFRPRSSTIGFRERNYSLQIAKGDYIAWLNVDNLVYPNWLQNHFDNLMNSRGAISVVNIQYWKLQEYWGVLPQALAYGKFDLLNYVLPLALAKKMNVFGPDVERIAHADWIAFERCSHETAVVWQCDQLVCACHF